MDEKPRRIVIGRIVPGEQTYSRAALRGHYAAGGVRPVVANDWRCGGYSGMAVDLARCR
jgi:hypothetical protein